MASDLHRAAEQRCPIAFTCQSDAREQELNGQIDWKLPTQAVGELILRAHGSRRGSFHGVHYHNRSFPRPSLTPKLTLLGSECETVDGTIAAITRSLHELCGNSADQLMIREADGLLKQLRDACQTSRNLHSTAMQLQLELAALNSKVNGQQRISSVAASKTPGKSSGEHLATCDISPQGWISPHNTLEISPLKVGYHRKVNIQLVISQEYCARSSNLPDALGYEWHESGLMGVG